MNGFFNLDLSTIWDDSKRIFFPEVDFGDPLQQEVGLSVSGDAGERAADRRDAPLFGNSLAAVPAWVWAVGAGILALLIVPRALKG